MDITAILILGAAALAIAISVALVRAPARRRRRLADIDRRIAENGGLRGANISFKDAEAMAGRRGREAKARGEKWNLTKHNKERAAILSEAHGGPVARETPEDAERRIRAEVESEMAAEREAEVQRRIAEKTKTEGQQ